MTQPETGPEITALLAVLNAQRRHIRTILEGLDEEALHRPVLPSGWNCLGLVRHLALDVEQFWFRGVVAGEADVVTWATTDHEEPWHVGPEVKADEVLGLYQRETALADAVVASASPESPLAWWPADLFGPAFLDNLRDVLLHVITETACHAGHLDAVRELIDGRKWLVLTE
ncbi:DinB family protein [Actinacidiphila acidipaludis]|uniref:DinB family protein n=1 Tax=Actinacidiphila acidipaludis TaxID=2873382 RepID=A0ABS7Q7C3_9ACTN|nr:DinB family protein [Streptomyces acidipaludis]MBY8878838.1 DinB family protein [Streptomyces acidipaludis]